MKILFPYLARWRSANRSRYHQLLTHLCAMGHQVYVLTAPPMAINDISANDLNSAEQLPAGLTVSELHAPPALRRFFAQPIPRTKLIKKGLLSLTSNTQIRRFVAREKIDVLLTYNLPQVRLLSSRVECRTHFDLADDLVAMMHVEDSVVSAMGGRAMAQAAQDRMIARATTVTVASSVLEEQIERPVLMLPNGADVEELDQIVPQRSQGAGPIVGFVGAFEYWVDFDLLLRAAARLPRVTFLLVGGGRQLDYVRSEVARLDLHNVQLTGALPYAEAMSRVAGMDVCLLPFTKDAVSDGSCPLKLFEYAALHKPIVSTRTREVARIGKGWIAFADEATRFAEAIELFLSDCHLSEQAGAAGRALVEQVYNWPNLTRQFEELLLNRTVPSFELNAARRTVLDSLEWEVGL